MRGKNIVKSHRERSEAIQIMDFRVVVAFLITMTTLLFSTSVYAACGTPVGNEGDIIYNSTEKILQYCDGNDVWQRMNQVAGSGSGGCTNPTRNEGEFVYNNDYNVLQVCAGNAWKAAGPVSSYADYTSIDGGRDHTCAIKRSGAIWCWGDDAEGQLGDSVAVSDSQVPVAIAENGPWKNISSGLLHTCAVKVDGTLWCWGYGPQGRLGDGATTDNTTPNQISEAGPWKMVSAGDTHTCAIKTDGTAWCWGTGTNNRLGDGDATSHSENDPVQVIDAGPWLTLSAGDAHTCGIKTDGTAYCWGLSSSNQLGCGGSCVSTDINAVSGGGTWTSIAAGDTHSCGVKSDGEIYCWGSDANGQLGNNAGGNQTSPGIISESGPWDLVATDGDAFHTCGIKSSGNIWCWGLGNNGRLGYGGGTSQTAQEVTEAGPWNDINLGSNHSCGIKADGTAWCWGRGNFGQIGNNDTADEDPPVEISGAGPWDYTGIIRCPDWENTTETYEPVDFSIAGGVNLNVGRTLAKQGDILAAGGEFGPTNGTVVLYDVSDPANPSELSEFDPSVGTARHGIDVAIDGGYMVSSDPRQGSNSGRVFLVDISNPATPVEKAIIEASDKTYNDHYGTSVALQGQYLYVAAPWADNGGTENTGAVYIYDISDADNPEEVSIIAPTVNYRDMGRGLDVQNHILAVTGNSRLWMYNISDPASPVLYFQSSTLHTSVKSVDIEGNLLAITEPDANSGKGEAHIYDISNPSSPVLRGTIQASDGVGGDNLGDQVRSVSIYGDYLAIGAWEHDNGAGASSGKAYLFDISDPTNPVELEIFVAADTAAGDRFGHSVVLDRNVLYVGAPGQEVVYAGRGGFYTYRTCMCSSPPEGHGRIIYNNTEDKMQYCNGTDWIGMGK